jgi:hypothetical protein
VSYDPTRVAKFLTLVPPGYEIDMFAHGLMESSVNTGSPYREFEALTPWERVNAIYEPRDRAVAGINARIALAVKTARDEDDQKEQP